MNPVLLLEYGLALAAGVLAVGLGLVLVALVWLYCLGKARSR